MPGLPEVETTRRGIEGLITTLLGSLVISLPLGNYIHQITDSIFSPYLRKRARIFNRKSVEHIEKVLGGECSLYSDKTFQALFVLSQSTSQSVERHIEEDKNTNIKSDINIDVIRENIRN